MTKLEVLISCMDQNDASLAAKSNVKTDVLLINQCGLDGFFQCVLDGCKIRMISTKEGGLSRSRNMALDHSKGQFCLLCDDDEVLKDGYEKAILDGFSRLPKADILAFRVENKKTNLRNKEQKVGRLKSLRLASCQLAFKRESLLMAGVRFDPLMGSGSGNGCGEENKFLLDCLKAGLSIYYVPKTIAAVRQGKSRWFSGYDEKFFFQRGSSTRYMLGLLPSMLYGAYYVARKRRLYKGNISMGKAARSLWEGIWADNINLQKGSWQGAPWKK